MKESLTSTEGNAYTERLATKESAWWKRLLDVQRPYRWNLGRLQLGFTLDVGCGLGRNLANLNGNGVGVDHNRTSIEEARRRGLQAFTVDDFLKSKFAAPGSFDSLLVAHVLEHMTAADATGLLTTYLPYVREGGKVVLITPQEAGQASDPTHVTFFDGAGLDALTAGLPLRRTRNYSFPFPRLVGKVFLYNENVWVGTHVGPAHAAS